MTQPYISGIAGHSGVTLLRLEAINATQWQQVVSMLAELNIETDMLQQSGQWPEQLTMSFSLAAADLLQVTEALQKITENSVITVHHPDQNLAKLSIIGIGIKSDPMLVARIFSQLFEMNVQIWALCHAESRFSVLIAAELLEKVAARLHQVLVTTES